MKRQIVFWVILMTSFCQLFAIQQLNLTVSAPGQVAAGERFRVVFTLNARPDHFQAPNFEGFRVLSGPSQSTSSSTQIINGQVTTSTSVSYTYVLDAPTEGSYTIGAAKATIDGKDVSSNTHSITVSGTANTGTQPQAGRQAPQTPSPQGQITSNDVFVRAHVSNTSPYQSEQVIVTYKLYTRLPISQYSIEKLPSYQAFWSENLTLASQPQTNTEVIDGVQYSTVELRRVALFPQRAGQLKLEPLEVNCLVRVRTQQRSGSIFDDFFGGSPFGGVQNVQHMVKSNALTLQVKPLPTQNKPATFKGLVGQFEITASLNQRELKVNEAANYALTIKGKGNMRMVEAPDILFPQNLEVFDPNTKDNIRNDLSGVSGSRSFDYLLIPRTAGEFDIPGIQFTYFNPVSEKYVTLTSESFSLNVQGGSGMAQDGGSTISRSDFQQISTDIRFIHTRPVALVPAGNLFFRSPLFYILLILPFLLFVGVLLIGRRTIRQRSNAQLMRNKRAEKMARKRLKKAAIFMKSDSHKDFYEEIFRALWGYLSDKLGIPVSKLNKDEVGKQLASLSISPELTSQLNDVLQEAEFARFAPVKQEQAMEVTYQHAIDMIVKLDKEIRINLVR